MVPEEVGDTMCLKCINEEGERKNSRCQFHFGFSFGDMIKETHFFFLMNETVTSNFFKSAIQFHIFNR